MHFDKQWAELKDSPEVKDAVATKMSRLCLSRIQAEARVYKEAFGVYPQHWFISVPEGRRLLHHEDDTGIERDMDQYGDAYIRPVNWDGDIQ